MKRVAVILTVFNRKVITIKGLSTLYRAIEGIGHEYTFDVYMTDDGSKDGTSDAVKQQFPSVIIINGDGSLFWGGGMRKAWQAAIDSQKKYDYYLWFNDDSELFPDALMTLFKDVSDDVIITGAFCDHSRQPSYGGKIDDNTIMQPNGELQRVNLMNGNLVLVPHKVYSSIGMIDKGMTHGGGDYDYGHRAKKCGFKVMLSREYVGISDRHDSFIPKCYSSDLSFKERWRLFHTPMYSPYKRFKYSLSYCGPIKTLKSFVISYVGVISPSIYRNIKNKIK